MTLKNVFIATVAAATLAAGASSANAMSGMNSIASVDAGQAIEKVGYFKKNGRFTNRGVATIGVGAAIVGGLIASRVAKKRAQRHYYQPAPSYSYRNAHVDWCLSRYRSYNPNTNLYNSYRYGWTNCRSPYGG